MQSYDGFRLIANIFSFISPTYSDYSTKRRQIVQTAPKSVAWLNPLSSLVTPCLTLWLLIMITFTSNGRKLKMYIMSMHEVVEAWLLSIFLVTQQKKYNFLCIRCSKIWKILKKAYLCSVRMKVLAIQVSFLRGQAVYVTTHFKAALRVRFYFL